MVRNQSFIMKALFATGFNLLFIQQILIFISCHPPPPLPTHHRPKQRPDIRLLIILLKQDMVIVKVLFGRCAVLPPGHFGAGGVGDNEGVENHGRIGQALFDFLDCFAEFDFVVAEPVDPAQAVGIHKADVLLLAVD